MSKKKLISKSNKYLATNHDVNVVKIKTERNSLGALKTIIVLFLILAQFALFLVSYLYFVSFFRWFAIFSIAMSLCTCIYVLSSDKNSQSKPIWVLFLLLCFSFGYIIYFISHESIFWGKYKKRYNKIIKKSSNLNTSANLKNINKQVQTECNYLQTAGGFTSFTNTDSKYFSSGASMFDSILADIEKAEKFIFIEYFIVSDGVLLNRFLSVLEQKVKQGVDVRIIYDDFGSHGSLKRKNKRKIKKSGVKLFAFNKLLPKFNVLLNYRDHRKIVVIDGKIAYTGGANLADEYTNEKRLHGYWKDAGIRLNGSAVDGFTLMFLRQWEFVSKQEQDYNKYINLAQPTNNTSVVVPYADGLDYVDNIGKNAYTNLIANSSHKLYIMSPYFVIDDTINNLLINKAKSGVDVRIVLPDVADKKFVYIVSRNNAEKLTKYGVKVYTLKNSFVHSKVMINENSAIVGSINMDLRSFYQQFESAVLINDCATMQDILTDFDFCFNNSIILDTTNFKRNRLSFRIVAGFTNLISPFM